jgi:hypothetical protein
VLVSLRAVSTDEVTARARALAQRPPWPDHADDHGHPTDQQRSRIFRPEIVGAIPYSRSLDINPRIVITHDFDEVRDTLLSARQDRARPADPPP